MHAAPPTVEGGPMSWDNWDDSRLDPRNRSRMTDTAHESQAACVAQRADPYATIGGAGQDNSNKLLQAMTLERTMEKAARDVAKSMVQDIAEEEGDGRRKKKRDKRLNEDGDEMSSGEEDEADAAKVPSIITRKKSRKYVIKLKLCTFYLRTKISILMSSAPSV